MRKMSTIAAVVLALFVMLLIISCGTDSPASEPGNSDVLVPTINPQTITLEEIVERTRTAMLGITSFRSTASYKTEYSGDGTTGGATYTTEWVAPNTTKSITDSTDENGRSIHNERIIFPTEEYTLESESGWKRRLTDDRSASKSSFPESSVFALHASDLSLGSKEDIAENGRPVFTLETFCVVSPTADSECIPDDNNDVDVFTHTVLFIDQQTFRIVQFFNTVEYGRRSETARVKNEISAKYYDYNEPITIEAPDEYEDWEGFTTTETIVVTTKADEPEHTPTSIPTQNCSEPGAVWPGCRIQNAADASVMLSTFPDEYKLFAGDDVAITFAFDRQPPVNWAADATFWYLPDGSWLEYCTSSPDVASSNSLSNGVTSVSTYDTDNYSAQAKLRIEELLQDGSFMKEVNSRINHLENRCG